jgi:hypothetical protein
MGVRVLTTGNGDRGSTLVPYMCGVLVVIVLGAISADMSHVLMAKRDLIELSGTIANDIATAGIDQDEFLETQTYRLDGTRAAQIAQRAIAHSSTDTYRPQVGGVRLIGGCGSAGGPDPCQVEATLTAHVAYIFGRALPGDRGIDLRVTSHATLEEG